MTMPNSAKGARAERRALLRRARREAALQAIALDRRRQRNARRIDRLERRYRSLSLARLKELADREVAKGKLKKVGDDGRPWMEAEDVEGQP